MSKLNLLFSSPRYEIEKALRAKRQLSAYGTLGGPKRQEKG